MISLLLRVFVLPLIAVIGAIGFFGWLLTTPRKESHDR